ncbi:MAG TPA: nuclear transport factor 2 family protein [Acidimicrobiales bacterium]|jgi:ketosteroid isomerase-like protein|nr:nuclear transport factor 2 family protein [Acidimicrobiales bacterium]|tara:strand:+ start:1110 stop:1475 length:366 start_codon:yes stop_codon:yes gene_type:complete
METEIQELEQQRWDAMIASDCEALGELLHPNLRYTHSNAAVDSKESYLTAIEKGVFDYQAVDNSEVEIQMIGDVALVNGTAQITVAARGTEFQLHSRYTCVWISTDTGWKFLAWQNTPITH